MHSYADPDDDWSRFLVKLEERKTALIAELVCGGMTPEQYHGHCGRCDEIGKAVELAKEVRLGRDLRPPTTRPRMPYAEE